MKAIGRFLESEALIDSSIHENLAKVCEGEYASSRSARTQELQEFVRSIGLACFAKVTFLYCICELCSRKDSVAIRNCPRLLTLGCSEALRVRRSMMRWCLERGLPGLQRRRAISCQLLSGYQYGYSRRSVTSVKSRS
jgi:hypothetical protein